MCYADHTQSSTNGKPCNVLRSPRTSKHKPWRCAQTTRPNRHKQTVQCATLATQEPAQSLAMCYARHARAGTNSKLCNGLRSTAQAGTMQALQCTVLAHPNQSKQRVCNVLRSPHTAKSTWQCATLATPELAQNSNRNSYKGHSLSTSSRPLLQN